LAVTPDISLGRIADLQDLKDETRSISRHGRKLAPIARDFSALIAQLEELARNATQISGSKMVFGLAEAALGGYTGKKDLLASGGEQTLYEAEKGWNLYSALKNLIHQKRVLAVQLVGLAPQFSGQVTTNNSFLSCSFREHTPGLFEIQTRRAISLINSSGKNLHNCVVAARLSNVRKAELKHAALEEAVGDPCCDSSGRAMEDHPASGLVAGDFPIFVVQTFRAPRPQEGTTKMAPIKSVN
jgi:hypothetical protein